MGSCQAGAGKGGRIQGSILPCPLSYLSGVRAEGLGCLSLGDFQVNSTENWNPKQLSMLNQRPVVLASTQRWGLFLLTWGQHSSMVFNWLTQRPGLVQDTRKWCSALLCGLDHTREEWSMC